MALGVFLHMLMVAVTAAAPITKVYILFSNHLDIGYTLNVRAGHATAC